MKELKGVRRTVPPGLARSTPGADFDEEMRFHVERVAKELEDGGLDPEQAREEALRQFGDPEKFRVEVREIDEPWEGEMKRAEWFDSIGQDLGYALRQLRKSKGFSAVAILTLALGIGATTTVFSVVNAVLLRPLPFDDPDELILVREVTPQGETFSTSEPNYLDVARDQRSFVEMAAVGGGSMNLTGDGEPVSLSIMQVTHRFLPMLRKSPALGRFFQEEEDLVGSEAAVVALGHELWTQRYGGDPEVVGRIIELDGESHLIVGVMPSEMGFADGTDLFVPMAPDPDSNRGNHEIMALGRLGAGVSLSAARQDLESLAGQLSVDFPESNDGWGMRLTTFEDWLIGADLSRRIWLLLAAVVLVLAMACANVSNLLIAKATVRDREMGIRAALGAGQGRLFRQLLTEGALLALLGTITGVALAYLAVPTVRGWGLDGIPRLDEVGLDGTVLLFTLIATALTSVVFGLVPGIHAAGKNVYEAVRQGDHPDQPWGRRLRDGLVIGELALAMIVLVGAGLMIRSFARLEAVDTGFDPDDVLTATVYLPDGRYGDEERMQFFRDATDRLQSIPGVSAVGASITSPFGTFRASNFVAPAEQNPSEPGDYLQIQWRAITPGYFDAMDVPLRRGRAFTWDDRPMTEDEDAPADVPVILSEALTAQLWPGVDPIGKVMAFKSSDARMIVTGTVADVRLVDVSAEPSPMVYFPYSVMPFVRMTFSVEVAGEVGGVVEGMRREIQAMDPNLPLTGVGRVEEIMRTQIAGPRFIMQLLGGFAVLALIMAAMGIYGVLTFAVAQRTREIGVRIALGAHPRRLQNMVLRHGMRHALVGLAIGLVGALVLARFMSTVLYETAPTDLATYATVGVLLAGIAWIASYLPAFTRIDPKIAFTAE